MLSGTGRFAGELAGEVEAPLHNFAPLLPFPGVLTRVGSARRQSLLGLVDTGWNYPAGSETITKLSIMKRRWSKNRISRVAASQ